MKMSIDLPEKIMSDIGGYNTLISLYHRIKNERDTEIRIDYSNVKQFDVHLYAVLGCVLFQVRETNEILFSNLPNHIRIAMYENEFLEKPSIIQKISGSFSGSGNTTIKFSKFKTTEKNLFEDYCRKELLSKSELPRMSTLLNKKIGESIFELFENTQTHSECKDVFSCGQIDKST